MLRQIISLRLQRKIINSGSNILRTGGNALGTCLYWSFAILWLSHLGNFLRTNASGTGFEGPTGAEGPTGFIDQIPNNRRYTKISDGNGN